MTRPAAILACLCLMASGCLSGARRGAGPSDLPRPWLVLEEACTLSPDGSQVCCHQAPFLAAAQGSVDTWTAATACRARLAECRAHGAVDESVCLTQRVELQARLDDPWRSPWLWAIIGVLAGGALVGGIVLGLP
uniref:Lipoprotein n=1 Tax=viral metagenome TaxID=1070528 RepID=A0A6H1ZRP3_9ZZZZ